MQAAAPLLTSGVQAPTLHSSCSSQNSFQRRRHCKHTATLSVYDYSLQSLVHYNRDSVVPEPEQNPQDRWLPAWSSWSQCAVIYPSSAWSPSVPPTAGVTCPPAADKHPEHTLPGCQLCLRAKRCNSPTGSSLGKHLLEQSVSKPWAVLESQLCVWHRKVAYLFCPDRPLHRHNSFSCPQTAMQSSGSLLPHGLSQSQKTAVTLLNRFLGVCKATGCSQTEQRDPAVPHG